MFNLNKEGKDPNQTSIVITRKLDSIIYSMSKKIASINVTCLAIV